MYENSCGKSLSGYRFHLSLPAYAPRKARHYPAQVRGGYRIAKDSFVACLGYLEVSQQVHFGKEATFANTAAGFADLLQWVGKHQAADSPRWFVVEATGVYYEELAYFLADNQ